MWVLQSQEWSHLYAENLEYVPLPDRSQEDDLTRSTGKVPLRLSHDVSSDFWNVRLILRNHTEIVCQLYLVSEYVNRVQAETHSI